MPIERYCILPECKGGENCIHDGQSTEGQCVYEYVASKDKPQFNWLGEEPPPSRWWADGTLVYRSFADYCDD